MAPVDPSVGTKKVRVNLSAFIRVECTEVIEVPASMNEDELKTLAQMRYENTDRSSYTQDSEYWIKGTVQSIEAHEHDKPSYQVLDNTVVPVACEN